jgi:hypothetical protein
VPNGKKETLMAKITAATVKGSVLYTDEFVSDNDLSSYGKHVPIGHRHEFADGEAHINGIEGFWSFAKRLHRILPRGGPGQLPGLPGGVRVPVQSQGRSLAHHPVQPTLPASNREGAAALENP